MNRNLQYLFIVIGASASSIWAGFNHPANALPNYQETCSNITISGNVLSASCKTRANKSKSTSLTLQGIQNINGRLMFSGSHWKISDYQLSCNSIRIRGYIINANCKTNDAKFNSTSITLYGIENNNGNLKYTSEFLNLNGGKK
jgi:hypothetical protein